MSRYQKRGETLSTLSILKKKEQRIPIAMVTCYDAAFAKIIERTDIDIVLVGDSVGNVVLGHDDTIPVRMEDMLHHTRAVARVLRRPLLCADMPFMSYHESKVQALRNAGELLRAGAHCVKLEGGQTVAAKVESLVTAGIPVMGHLGLTPQSVHQLGGYRIQGKSDKARSELLKEAKRLEEAGAFSLVLEMVPAELAREVSESLKIPTIGIGAGPMCDGQVLVLHDLLGFDDEAAPSFVKKYARIGNIIEEAVDRYAFEVKSRAFPAPIETKEIILEKIGHPEQ